MNIDINVFLKKYKNLIIGVGVALLIFGGYFLFRGGDDTNVNDTLSFGTDPYSPGSSSVGQDILSVLNELQSIEIDNSIFSSAVFRSLVDYTIATSSETKSRPDPFAPLPFELDGGEDN